MRKPKKLQKVNLLFHWFVLDLSHFLVVTGESTAVDLTKTKRGEVFSQKVSDKTCDFLPQDFEKGVHYATGSLLLDSFHIICGGNLGSNAVQKDCFIFKGAKWTKLGQMNKARESAASIALNATSLWITGGSDDTSTEILTLKSDGSLGM